MGKTSEGVSECLFVFVGVVRGTAVGVVSGGHYGDISVGHYGDVNDTLQGRH